MELDAAPEQAQVSTIKDITAGAAGGIAQVLIGQPFDIVKVRLQTQASISAYDCARDIWLREGPLAFYKGSLVPLLGIGACVSVQFGAFHSICHLVKSNNLRHSKSSDSSLTLLQFYLCGGGAGVTNSIISGPIEHVRIRLQTQPVGRERLYSGPAQCIKAILHQSGIQGLYRGQGVTILREFHGYGIWFAAFEALMINEMRQHQITREDIPSYKVALYGGLAGEALWLGSHPLDVLKSKMQSDGFGAEQKYRSATDCLRQTWRYEGFRGLWKGLGPALLRAMPVSAGTFATVEIVRRALG